MTKLDSEIEKYYYSLIGIIAVITESINHLQWWRALKSRLNKYYGQSVTSCNRLKMPANDGNV